MTNRLAAKFLVLVVLTMTVIQVYAEECAPPSFYTSLPRDREWFYGVGKDSDTEKARLEAIHNLGKQVTGDMEKWDAAELDALAGPGQDRWKVAKQVGRLLPGSTLLAGWEQDDFERCNGKSYVLVRVEKERVDNFIKENMRFKNDLLQSLAERVGKVEQDLTDLQTSYDGQARRLAYLEQTVAKLSGKNELSQQIGEIRKDLSTRQPVGQIEKKLTAAERTYNRYFDNLRAEAAKGDAEAQFSLGGIYLLMAHDDNGSSRYAKLAAEWFEKAAAQGHAGARHNLGALCEAGAGVPRNCKLAAMWYQKAAEQGDMESQSVLGGMYFKGQGVSKDFDLAAKWYRKAADQGYAEAQMFLGVMYARGKGVPKDIGIARGWFLKAAEKGNTKAAYLLGAIYADGEGTPIDLAMAMRWYQKAADQGDAKAQFAIGNMHYRGRGVPSNIQLALDWFRKAAMQGYPEAQGQLGDLYYEGLGVSKNRKLAADWYRKSARQGDAMSQKMLGDMYAAGDGVPRDVKIARHWYQKAAKQGDAEAKKGLAALGSLSQ